MPTELLRDASLSELEIRSLLHTFYDRVRRDELLGPVFNDVVESWDDHLDRIGDFWSSVTLASGHYKGNPLAMHLLHADRITPEMFERWLALWAAATTEMLPITVARAMQDKAARIAVVIKSAMDLTRY